MAIQFTKLSVGPEVVQSIGTSETAVMSQNAVTTELLDIKTQLEGMGSGGSSGGTSSGGVTMESYTNTSFANVSGKIMELYNANKLLGVRINFLTSYDTSAGYTEIFCNISTGEFTRTNTATTSLTAGYSFLFRPTGTLDNGTKLILSTMDQHSSVFYQLHFSVGYSPAFHKKGFSVSGTGITFYGGYATLGSKANYSIDIIHLA